VTIEYLDLADYIAIAAEVTGLDVATLLKVTSLDLADSALHAPSAGFADTDFYPDFIDKAAVLIVRLACNHPLPDGNKRAAWVALRLFITVNEWRWHLQPTVDEAEHAVLAVASGEWDETAMASWLRGRLLPRKKQLGASEMFSRTQAAQIAEISYRQLSYWVRIDLVRPSVNEAARYGSRLGFSYRDVLLLRLCKDLLNVGVNRESVREVVEMLRKRQEDEFATTNIVISGTAAVLCDSEQLADALRREPGAVHVLQLDAVKVEVDSMISYWARRAQSDPAEEIED
jgi:death on curing protein